MENQFGLISGANLRMRLNSFRAGIFKTKLKEFPLTEEHFSNLFEDKLFENFNELTLNMTLKTKFEECLRFLKLCYN